MTLIDSKKPVIEQLMKTREDKGGGSVLAVQVVPREKTKGLRYRVKVAEKGDVTKVESIIENRIQIKPRPPWLLSADIFLNRKSLTVSRKFLRSRR